MTYLSVIGGKNVEKTIKRTMAAVIGPTLSKQFNWYGKKGKKSFKKLQLGAIVFGESFISEQTLIV